MAETVLLVYHTISNKLAQKHPDNIGNSVPKRPDSTPRFVPFVYAGNGTHVASNHLIFTGCSLENGTFPGKIEQKWNALAQKRDGTVNWGKRFIDNDLLSKNGTKSGTKWNDVERFLSGFPVWALHKTCFQISLFERRLQASVERLF